MNFQEGILQKYGVLINLLLSVCFACNLANGPVVSSAVVALVVVLAGRLGGGRWRKEDSGLEANIFEDIVRHFLRFFFIF